MTKQQRDAFKGRVKRLLHAQKDMGQVSEPALQCCGACCCKALVCCARCSLPYSLLRLDAICVVLVTSQVTAIEAFVRDIGRKLALQAATAAASQQEQHESDGDNHAVAVTPVQLKHVVLADPALAFLHDKVTTIDDNDRKYHRKSPATRKRSAAAAPKSKNSSATTTTTRMRPTKRTKTQAATVASVATSVATSVAQALVIDEDANYDESESESE